MVNKQLFTDCRQRGEKSDLNLSSHFTSLISNKGGDFMILDSITKSKKGGNYMKFIFSGNEPATYNSIHKFEVLSNSKECINGLILPNHVVVIYQIMTAEEELKQTIEFFEKMGLVVHYSGYQNDSMEEVFQSIDRMDVYKRSASFEIYELFGTKNPFSIFD